MEPVRDRKVDLLLHILSLQRSAEGLLLDQEIAVALGIEFYEIHRAADQITVRIPVHLERIPIDPILLLSTMILVRVLEYYFENHQDKWESVVDKSRSWLHMIMNRFRPEISGQDLMSWADDFVRHIHPPDFLKRRPLK